MRELQLLRGEGSASGVPGGCARREGWGEGGDVHVCVRPHAYTPKLCASALWRFRRWEWGVSGMVAREGGSTTLRRER